jgi:hypothetical protein
MCLSIRAIFMLLGFYRHRQPVSDPESAEHVFEECSFRAGGGNYGKGEASARGGAWFFAAQGQESIAQPRVYPGFTLEIVLSRPALKGTGIPQRLVTRFPAALSGRVARKLSPG